MITKLAMLLALTIACNGGKDDDDDDDDSGEDPADDTGTVGDDTGATGDWEPAAIEPGVYAMRVNEVVQHTCGGVFETGTIENVNASFDGIFVNLWGFAKMEDNGPSIRANGTRKALAPEAADCTITDTITSTGVMSKPTKFTLDVVRNKSGVGADCDSLPGELPCTQNYKATFVRNEGTPDDTGGPD